MDSKINYTAVGVFLIVLIAVGIAIFMWLSAMHHEQTYTTYRVYVKEDVTGLATESPVRFNGVDVGFVKAIELDPRNPQLVRLTLRIVSTTPISTSTVAELQFQGITGVLYVGLKALSIDAPLLKAKPGQKYPVIPAQPSLLVQLGEVLPEITKNIKSVGASIGKVFDEQNQEAIRSTLQNMKKFTQTLSNNSKELDASIKSLDVTLKNSSIASKQLPEVMTKLNKTLTSVDSTASDISQAAKSVTHTMTSSRAAVDALSNQVMPSAQQMMSRLNRVSSNLESITADVKSNPSVLIRGKAPAAPGPGER